MSVQEYDAGPVIERQLYDFINRELYTETNAPVMMRLGLDEGRIFGVNAENAVPRDVLALPPELFDKTGTQNVFVLKGDYVDNVGKYYG